jgi:uncharacterized membrane protein
MAEENLGQARVNIETVARLEAEFLQQRSLKDRIGDAIAAFAGTMTFVLVHVAGLILWFLINTGSLPFILLALIVSVEGVLLSTFILMKQNRMSRHADHRDHLNLQIDLLAEKEITKILEMQRQLCAHLGIAIGNDAEAVEMSQHTAVEDLAHELEEKLPAE